MAETIKDGGGGVYVLGVCTGGGVYVLGVRSGWRGVRAGVGSGTVNESLCRWASLLVYVV